MKQDEVNQAEWHNPENWSDNLVGIYFSKRDKRVWVPKRRPGLGWTLNLANRWGAWWVVGLLVVPPILSGLLAGRTKRSSRKGSRTRLSS